MFTSRGNHLIYCLWQWKVIHTIQNQNYLINSIHEHDTKRPSIDESIHNRQIGGLNRRQILIASSFVSLILNIFDQKIDFTLSIVCNKYSWVISDCWKCCIHNEKRFGEIFVNSSCHNGDLNLNRSGIHELTNCQKFETRVVLGKYIFLAF